MHLLEVGKGSDLGKWMVKMKEHCLDSLWAVLVMSKEMLLVVDLDCRLVSYLGCSLVHQKEIVTGNLMEKELEKKMEMLLGIR